MWCLWFTCTVAAQCKVHVLCSEVSYFILLQISSVHKNNIKDSSSAFMNQFFKTDFQQENFSWPFLFSLPGVASSWVCGTPTPQWETSWAPSLRESSSPQRGDYPSSSPESSSPALGSCASSSWLRVSFSLSDKIQNTSPKWALGFNVSRPISSFLFSEPEDVNCSSPQHHVSCKSNASFPLFPWKKLLELFICVCQSGQERNQEGGETAPLLRDSSIVDPSINGAISTEPDVIVEEHSEAISFLGALCIPVSGNGTFNQRNVIDWL